MRLSPVQVSAVVSYLQQVPNTACSLCGQQEWKVSETIFALPEYVAPALNTLLPFLGPGYAPVESPWEKAMKKEPEVFPVIPIVCGRCGFVFFISAVAAGVIAAKPGGVK
jgi:hypothetical protein